ncbi:MAG: GNAT family N-acetyltransferase [Pseudomonadota bacterium]
MSLTLRDAVHADLATLAALYEASGLDPAGRNHAHAMEAAWARLHNETPTARVLVAERDGDPVGTLTCFVLPSLAHGGLPAAVVEAVAVHPKAQGQGVGRALMAAAMELARTAGCYKLALSSNEKRGPAHAFYERLGFDRHGVSFVATPEAVSA